MNASEGLSERRVDDDGAAQAPDDHDQRSSLADEREAALDAREVRADARDVVQADRKERTTDILADADKRDLQADARDAAATMRDTLVGLAAMVFSALYLISDLMELVQGGFSAPQLLVTYAAEAAIPLFVLGLYSVQRPQVGRLGLASAAVYAYAFVYFTSTVVYALVERTSDWQALERRLGVWITIHSVLMVVAGVGFGIATIRARVLPRWTGVTLIAGMLLMAVTVSLPAAAQTASAGVRDVAFAAMGAALLARSGLVGTARQAAVAGRRPREQA